MNENADNHCDEKSIANCSCLSRIIYSLKQYQSMTRNEFIKFIMNEYGICLDDYIHLISIHSNQLYQITNYLQSKYDLIKCDNIKKCKYTQRHYRERGKNNNNNDEIEEEEDEYNFYGELLDIMHFYLFHVEELGLRISDKDKKNENDDNNRNYLNFIDQIEHNEALHLVFVHHHPNPYDMEQVKGMMMMRS